MFVFLTHKEIFDTADVELYQYLQLQAQTACQSDLFLVEALMPMAMRDFGAEGIKLPEFMNRSTFTSAWFPKQWSFLLSHIYYMISISR